MAKGYKICARCLMDTTDPDITFDENGICNHCSSALKKLDEISFHNETNRQKKIEEIISIIKKSGKNRKYDCLIGLSGGVDSSYLAYIVVKKLGLRPLAVHVDNGWNSELAVQNIENIVKKLNIDLFTYVIDWEEFKDLQRAYLKASVLDLEVLSDNAIVITIHELLKKYRLKYFLIGFNYKAESIMPSSWLYSPKYDSRNIRSIYKQFGSGRRLKTYPLLNIAGYIYYRFLDKSRSINILDLVPYKKEDAIKILQEELGWRDYGGKHWESKITHFYQAFILPAKFNIDKRKAHLSSLILSGQITREQAMQEMCKPLMTDEQLEDEKSFFLKKLDLTNDEFNKILQRPAISHYKYPSFNRIFQVLIDFKNKIISVRRG